MNVDAVAEALSGAVTLNAGQVCCTATRWLVHEKIRGAFVKKATESAIFHLPYRRVKGWSWESYWIVGGVFSWIVVPWIIAALAVPNLVTTLVHAPPKNLLWSYFFGVLWGVGGATFGLTVRYLGFALGTAMALGYCAAFGTLLPPIVSGEFAGVIATTSGLVVMGGVVVCLLGIVISGFAGIAKEREVTDATRRPP